MPSLEELVDLAIEVLVILLLVAMAVAVVGTTVSLYVTVWQIFTGRGA